MIINKLSLRFDRRDNSLSAILVLVVVLILVSVLILVLVVLILVVLILVILVLVSVLIVHSSILRFPFAVSRCHSFSRNSGFILRFKDNACQTNGGYSCCDSGSGCFQAT